MPATKARPQLRGDGKPWRTNRTRIVLIGMPGAGKSTVGVVLAKRLGLDFVDTDVLIQTRTGRRLQEIIDGDGLEAFCRLEEETLLQLDAPGTVIATGGSVIYTEKGMAALKNGGVVVYLEVPLAVLESRIRDMDTRGLVVDPGETFENLYRRRLPLYRRCADLTVDAGGKSVEAIAAEIENRLGSERNPTR